MGLKSVRATGAEAISLSTLKTQLRQADPELESELKSKAEAALDWAETETGRAIVTQTVTLTLDSFPCQIRLPRSPLVSVTSVAYLDTAGDSQTLASSVYRVSTAAEPPVISLARNQSWPGTDAVKDAVTVTYQAGYGSSESDVPSGLREAMLLMMRFWMDDEPLNKTAAERLIRNYKLGWHAAANGLSQAVV